MKLNHVAAMFAVDAVLAVSAGCEEEKGPAERAGERIDDATDKLRGAASEAKKDLKEAARDAEEAAKDAADELDD
jgi:uncharacterized protein YjbJ (UPF0337 family)